MSGPKRQHLARHTVLHIPVLVQQRQEEEESEAVRTSIKGTGRRKERMGGKGRGKKGEREGWVSLSGDPKRQTGLMWVGR